MQKTFYFIVTHAFVTAVMYAFFVVVEGQHFSSVLSIILLPKGNTVGVKS